jgi:hypothetical protein
MNRTRFELTGGFPLTLDDLDFFQQAMRDGFRDVLAQWGTRIRLWGSELTWVPGSFTGGLAGPGTWTVTEGAVYREGEVLYVPASTGQQNNGPVLNIVPDITYPPDNPVAFNDASLNNVNEIRRARVQNAPVFGSAGPDNYNAYIPLVVAIANALPGTLPPTWSAFTQVPAAQGNHTLRYRRDLSGCIHVRGTFTPAGGFIGNLTGNIPASIAPTGNRTIIGCRDSGESIRIQVPTTGPLIHLGSFPGSGDITLNTGYFRD